MTTDQCCDFREQIISEFEACHSIYADDFQCFKVNEKAGGSLEKLDFDGEDDNDGAAARFLALLRLPVEESVVDGQGFLHVLVDRAPSPASKGSQAHSVALLYSNTALTAAQQFYVNCKLAQQHISSLPDAGIAATQYWLADFFVEVRDALLIPIQA